jgi:hypothetical protein
MADSIQILQDPAIAEFKDMLKKCTLQAVCGREYVLVEKLTKWLRSKRPGSHTTYANRLLQAVYRSKSKHAPAPPIPIEILCHHKGGCLLVFSILLELGRGELAHCFQRQGIIDQNLPIDLHTLRTELGRIKTKELPDLETLADKFDRMQWRFSPTQLSLYMDREFPEKRIIPIHRKKKINCKGGTAEVWQILVLEEFVSDDLRQVVESSGFSDGRDELGYVSSKSVCACSPCVCTSTNRLY